MLHSFDVPNTPLFARGFLSPGVNLVFGVAFDGLGNLGVAGYFRTRLDASGPTLDGAGNADGFIAILDPDGDLVRLVPMAGAGNDVATDIVGLPGGGFLVVGEGYGTLSVDTTLLVAQQTDLIVAKLDALGGVVWARTFGGSDHETQGKVALGTNGRAIVGGTFRSTIDVAGQTFTDTGNGDLVYVEIDLAAGTPLRAWHEGGAAIELMSDLEIDPASDDCISIGTFEGTTTIGGRAATSGGTDMFFHRFATR